MPKVGGLYKVTHRAHLEARRRGWKWASCSLAPSGRWNSASTSWPELFSFRNGHLGRRKSLFWRENIFWLLELKAFAVFNPNSFSTNQKLFSSLWITPRGSTLWKNIFGGNLAKFDFNLNWSIIFLKKYCDRLKVLKILFSGLTKLVWGKAFQVLNFPYKAKKISIARHRSRHFFTNLLHKTQ